MNEFERAKQEFAAAECLAKRLREEAEAKKIKEQEEKARLQREKLAIIVCNEATFSRISPEVIVILQRINAELFSDKGNISRWQKAQKTYIHRYTYEDFGSDFNSTETMTGYRKMCTSRMETSLRIPNLGSVLIYFPLETTVQALKKVKGTYKHVWTEWETERDCICIESDSVPVGDYQDNAEKIKFNRPDEDILKKTQKTIIKACVNMRKKSLGLHAVDD
jgi:hypothetical protein